MHYKLFENFIKNHTYSGGYLNRGFIEHCIKPTN